MTESDNDVALLMTLFPNPAIRMSLRVKRSNPAFSEEIARKDKKGRVLISWQVKLKESMSNFIQNNEKAKGFYFTISFLFY
jgi:hypothetical protein